MASGDAERRAGADGADLWDAAADERQRLADEREQLSNERERLADERERLADEHERLLDQRYAARADDVLLDTALDDEFARVEAEGNLVRSEARLQPAVAERTSGTGRARTTGDERAAPQLRRRQSADRVGAAGKTTSTGTSSAGDSSHDANGLPRCVTSPRTPGTSSRPAGSMTPIGRDHRAPGPR